MLYKDGLHDDTAAIQQLLDKGGSVTVESGIYLISRPLIIHDNTRLQLAPDAVMKLADGANCAILENDALPLKGAEYNCNISVNGGIWDGNNENQQRRSRESRFALTKFEDDYYYGIFMRFVGVKNLCVSSMTVRNPESYAMLICAAENFTVENISFDYNLLRLNMDGIHVQGPANGGVIRNIAGTTNDDLVALNCDDVFASEITRGNIENILIDGLFSENGYTALRLLSCGSQMRNISVRNIFGTYGYYGVSFTHHKVHPGEKPWFDNILIDGVFASKPEGDTSDHPIIWFEEGVRAGNISIKNLCRTQKEMTNAPTLRLVGDVRIKRLLLSNIYENLSDRSSFTELDGSCVENLIKEATGSGG